MMPVFKRSITLLLCLVACTQKGPGNTTTSAATQNNKIYEVGKEKSFLHEVEIRGASTIPRNNAEKKEIAGKTFYMDEENLISSEDFTRLELKERLGSASEIQITVNSIGQKIFQDAFLKFPEKSLLLVVKDAPVSAVSLKDLNLTLTEFHFALLAAKSREEAFDLFTKIKTGL